MNRFRFVAFATVFCFALNTTFHSTMNAQQPTAGSASAQGQQGQGDAHSGTMPSVEEHLKFLSQALALTSEQQDKATPILREMQDAMLRINGDGTLTDEQRRDELKAVHTHADLSLRQFLSDEQKEKLDQLEQPHPVPDTKG